MIQVDFSAAANIATCKVVQVFIAHNYLSTMLSGRCSDAMYIEPQFSRFASGNECIIVLI